MAAVAYIATLLQGPLSFWQGRQPLPLDINDLPSIPLYSAFLTAIETKIKIILYNKHTYINKFVTNNDFITLKYISDAKIF